jgi:phosphatidate cytidylyltransferase
VSSFVSRIVVTVVALPVVLWLVWLGGWWLTGLAIVAALIALHELYGMARSLRPLVLAGYAGAILTLVGAEAGGYPWMIGGALATLPLAFVLYGIAETRQSATVSISTTVLGVVWIPLALGHLVLLRDVPEHGRLAIFTVLLAVFADSTFAYFVGRMIGRHRLAPAISPGKTVEGFLAGTIAAVAVCFFALYEERDAFLSIWQAMLFGVVVAAAEPLGDLFESAVKRDLHVKDSGRLLAGHGGMLDRIDSLLFAGPAALFAILAFGYGGAA